MAYMEEQAQERERIRRQMLGGYEPRDIGAIDPQHPQIQANVRRPQLTSPGLEALLAGLAQALAPGKVKVDEMRDLKVPLDLGGRPGGGDHPGWRDSGVGNIDLGGLKGLKNKLEQARGEAPKEGAKLKDMVTRGKTPVQTPQQKADANVEKARDLIPGLKPGVDTSVPPAGSTTKMAYPSEPAARAYMTEKRTDIPPVVGVDKNAPVAEGYKADLKFLEERGGHTTKLVDGKETHTSLTEKGSYKDLDPELAARLVNAAKDFEKQTGKQARFGEFSRGEDVQKVYHDKYKAGTGGIAAAPGHSHHQHGTAGDLPSGSGFRQWLTNPENGNKYGLHFPVKGDAPHVEMNPSYKGPTYAKADTPTYGPGVIDTSKLPPWDTSKPKYTAVTEPPGGWPDPTKFTPADQIKMAIPPVTAPNVLPESMGGPPKGSVQAGGGAPGGVPPELSKLVMSKEWFVATPKPDYGQMTIGYGTSANGRTSITEPEARAEMNAQLAKHLEKIDANFPNLPPKVRNSIASLTYNVGENWITEPGGRLAAALKAGDMKAAKEVFLEYKHVHENGVKKELRGLRDRRIDEARAFDGLDPQYTKNPDAPPGSQPDVPPQATAAAPNVKVAGPVPAPDTAAAPPPKPPPPPKDPVPPGVRAAHGVLDMKVKDFIGRHAPEYLSTTEKYHNNTVREVARMPLVGSMLVSRGAPLFKKLGITEKEFTEAINAPPPPPPPKAPPPPAPAAAPPAQTPPLTPEQVKAAPPQTPQTPPTPSGPTTTGTVQGDTIQNYQATQGGPGGPGTVQVEPTPTTTEITVRKAPEPAPGTVVEGVRGGEPGTAAKVELPAETAPDAAETAAPEGKGAGDSTMLPPVEVDETAKLVSSLPPETGPSTAAFSPYEGFRPSTNVEDRRLEAALPADKAAAVDKNWARNTPEVPTSELSKALGEADLKAYAEAHPEGAAVQGVRDIQTPIPKVAEVTKATEATTEEPGVKPTEASTQASAEASAAEVAQAGPAPQATPVVTPEIAKAAVEAVKTERAPVMKPQLDAQPVRMATDVARPQAGAPGGPLSLAPPGLAAIEPTGGAMPGTPGSQGGAISMLGLAPMPVNNAVFSTPLLDAAAQQPQMGQGNLAPFPWQETAGWGWGGSSLGGFGGGDFGGGFSDYGGGLGSGLGFFGSTFGG